MKKQPPSSSNPNVPAEGGLVPRVPYPVPIKPSSASSIAHNIVNEVMNRVNSTTPVLPNGNGHPNANASGPINGVGPTPSENGPNPPLEDPVANYTLQGVMQWLNGEYRRYERDRNAWQIERSYLVVDILWMYFVDGIGSSGEFDGHQIWTTEV